MEPKSDWVPPAGSAVTPHPEAKLVQPYLLKNAKPTEKHPQIMFHGKEKEKVL